MNGEGEVADELGFATRARRVERDVDPQRVIGDVHEAYGARQCSPKGSEVFHRHDELLLR